jgi:leucyl-tRNA synthetase
VTHLLQTQSELEKHENKGLRAALDTKKKRKEKKYTLDFGEPRENTGSAMFHTPSKVKKAQFI